MLAPIASRQSTWTCTITRPGSARTSSSRAPPPRATSRGSVACASASSSSPAASRRAARGVAVGDADDLDLRGHDRLVGLGDEAAALADHARRVRRRGDDRRLLDRHRHQVVAAVDAEVEPDARAAARRRRRRSRPPGRRSPCRARRRPASRRSCSDRSAREAQQLAPLGDRQPVEAGDARARRWTTVSTCAFLDLTARGVRPRRAGLRLRIVESEVRRALAKGLRRPRDRAGRRRRRRRRPRPTAWPRRPAPRRAWPPRRGRG